MSFTEAIFIFTKNRIDTFERCISRISTYACPVFVIDDSTNEEVKTKVRMLTRKCQNSCYLDNETYQYFLTEYNIEVIQYDLLCGVLGTTEWNLGLARNYAMLLAQEQGFEKVLFVDDDIIINDVRQIQATFDELNIRPIVGSEITGLIDNSVVGHIANRLDLTTYAMLSGGFLAFRPAQVTYYFTNCYNEDWLWQYFNNFSGNMDKLGTVEHVYSDPMVNANIKAIFQEFGEVALDCVSIALLTRDLSKLTDKKFLTDIKAKRSAYLTNLITLAKEKGEGNLIEILVSAKTTLSEISTEKLSIFFSNFINQNAQLVAKQLQHVSIPEI